MRWPGLKRFQLPLSELPGIGPKLASQAGEAGIETLFDLLWRVPRTYRESPDRIPLAELAPGHPALVEAELLKARRVRVRRRGFSVVEGRIADDSGEIKVLWFNQPWVADRLKPGERYLLEGRLENKGFTVSAMEPVGTETGPATAHPGQSAEGEGHPAEGGGRSVDGEERPPEGTRSRPGVAGAGRTLSTWGSGQPPGLGESELRGRHSGTETLKPARWRRWAWQASALTGELPEPLPAALLGRHRFPGSAAAIREAHFPVSGEGSELATSRLAYEELFLHQVVLRRGRVEMRMSEDPAPALTGGGEGPEPGQKDKPSLASWAENLPFELTGDQARAIAAIDADLTSEAPMRRLLMGEVGAGKTVVAVRAILRAATSGCQSAMMAPTEVLAEQHAATLGRLLAGTGVRLALLTGSVPAKRRREIHRRLVAGEVDILIGTHALLVETVEFNRLALCVVDEEHRFGVEQRAKLAAKAPPGRSAHLLQMTATPIPRTLSLTTYGDLEITALRELPAGRLSVRTEIVREPERGRALDHVKAELGRGRQAIVVCPLIEGSIALEARAATAEAERLRDGDLREFEVGLIHGQMTSEQKELAMAAFEDGRTDVLVATTVIEVGIDVANATVMVIEGADRFGLSQLHQLRGRVGRGSAGGVCFLIPGTAGVQARRRLEVFASESDGFRISEIDLELRGEGEITGTRQHGLPRFRVAELPRDAELLESARADLEGLLAEHGGLDSPALSPMSELAGARFGPEGIRR